MSNFDPDAFMNETIDQPLETERTMCPPGEYRMMIDDFEAAKALERIEFEYKKGPNAGLPGQMTVFNCPCVVLDDKVKAELEQDKVVVFKRIMLDLDDNNRLVWGKNKNTDLGQLRHAVKQNQAGQWNIAMLRGAGPFVGRVDKKTGTRKDGSPFESREVGRVTQLA